VQLRDDLHLALKILAAKRDTTLLNLISDAVEMYLQKHEKP
jgi:predicted transcriptional regulator